MSLAEAGRGAATRGRLVRAAERLFAARGIEGVSLREINRSSGARNAIAVQYHFKDREGIVQAILDKHVPDIDRARHGLLDDYEQAGRDDLWRLADALVRPLAAKLSDPDGGPEYLQVYADLLNRPRPVIRMEELVDESDSIYRWRRLVEPFVDAEALRLHRRFTVVFFTVMELARVARGGTRTDQGLFVSHLVDVVAAMLTAPVSTETRAQVARRDGSQPSGRKASSNHRR